MKKGQPPFFVPRLLLGLANLRVLSRAPHMVPSLLKKGSDVSALNLYRSHKGYIRGNYPF